MNIMELAVDPRVFSPIIAAIIAFLLNKYFYNKVNLIAYYGYASSHTLPFNDGLKQIGTHELRVKNSGKLTAKNVRVGHHNIQVYYNVSCLNKYEISKSEETGTLEILFGHLVPEEEVRITYCYFHPIRYEQVNSYVRSDEALAKVVSATLTENIPQWQKIICWLIFFIGLSTVIYLIITLLSNFIY